MLPAPFLAMHPDDDLAWLAVADWLEEDGRPLRAELVRLTRLLREEPDAGDRPRREARVIELLGAAVEPCVATATNSVGMELAYIPAGKFLMGSPREEEGRFQNEGPEHYVTITRPFHMGVYAVTQIEWEAISGDNPSHFAASGEGRGKVEGLDTSRFPVERVSHEDAIRFCESLSARPEERGAGRTYRLPTEAEWEYACRGGTTSFPFHFGSALSSDRANFDGNHPYGSAEKGPFLERTCEVGSYPPNAFGLHDMHGNVWEWCSDWYDAAAYEDEDEEDPEGLPSGSYRVVRGGCWANKPSDGRAANRLSIGPSDRSSGLGFRVCLKTKS